MNKKIGQTDDSACPIFLFQPVSNISYQSYKTITVHLRIAVVPDQIFVMP